MTAAPDRTPADLLVARLAVEVAKLEDQVLGGSAADTVAVVSLVRELGEARHAKGDEKLDERSARLLAGLITDLDKMILRVEREMRSLRRAEGEHAATATAQLAYAKNALR